MTQKDTPKLWRDMTDAEKGALLLAHHEGKEIEQFDLGHWGIFAPVEFLSYAAYRIKPEPKKPREAWMDDGGCFWGSYEEANQFCSNEKPKLFREVMENDQ